MTKLLSVEEVAKILRVAKSTVYDIIHIEGFPCVKLGRAWKVPEDLLMEWIKEQSKAPKY